MWRAQVRELKKRQQKQLERERKVREKQLERERAEREAAAKLKAEHDAYELKVGAGWCAPVQYGRQLCGDGGLALYCEELPGSPAVSLIHTLSRCDPSV